MSKKETVTRLSDSTYATLDFTLSWESREASHFERFLARKANLWRDIFPPGFKEALTGLEPGQRIRMEYEPGQAMPRRDESLLRSVPATAAAPMRAAGRTVLPRAGRFFPRGLLGNLPGTYPQDVRPARILDQSDGRFLVDLNHPMAGRPLALEALVLDAAPKRSDTGGRLTSWMEEICDFGPGMQARAPGGRATDFGGPGAWSRLDEEDDAVFYREPRLVGHVDAQASDILRGMYASRLTPGARVLDLMSSVQSHLPGGLGLDVTGLGMNMRELEANPALSRRIVHDLNASPALPFEDAAFDAAAISLSLEYLLRPREVVRECARVLAPGGQILIGFSNRWFPSKATAVWMDLHEFERMGLALDLLMEDGGFEGLWTGSARNWWRPSGDPHIRETWTSDPVYVAGGTRRR
ncbi:MAG: methyltransferase domain-containing protein [Thermodesulfobacteriota bacterium]